MKVLDKGEVKLLDYMGGDLNVVAAARVSNGITKEEASKGEASDQKLINYLVKHRHGTPFEHTTFQFYLKVPLFVRTQILRHRIASYNEVSGRYVEYGGEEVPLEFYLPNEFRKQSNSNKQGSVQVDAQDEIHFFGAVYTNSLIGHAQRTYNELLHAGIAKEMARMVLPQNLYTQLYMTINARSLMNFLSLRCAPDAQYETRQYALCMKDFFEEVMPMTYKAWVENGEISI